MILPAAFSSGPQISSKSMREDAGRTRQFRTIRSACLVLAAMSFVEVVSVIPSTPEHWQPPSVWHIAVRLRLAEYGVCATQSSPRVEEMVSQTLTRKRRLHARIRVAAVAVLGWLSFAPDNSWAAAAGPPASTPPSELKSTTVAKAAFERGVRLVEQRRFAEAAAAFQTAYDAEPHYSVLYNIARAHIAAGALQRGIKTLEQYLEEGDKQLSRARYRQVVANLEELRAQIAFVRVTVTPSTAVIYLDGRPLPPSSNGARIPLNPGQHSLIAIAEGRGHERRELKLEPGDFQALQIELQPRGSDAPTSAALDVRCEVPEVTLYLDGTRVAGFSGRTLLILEPREHTVRFERDGYLDDAQQALVRVGAHGTVTCDLAPSAALSPAEGAVLAVQVTVPGAFTTVDGTSWSGPRLLPAGAHRVNVQREGFLPWTGEVSLLPGHPQTVTVNLVPTATSIAEHERYHRRATNWAYGMGIAAGVLAAGATILAIDNHERLQDWRNEQARLDSAWGSLPPGERGPVEQQDRNDARARDVGLRNQVVVGLGTAAGIALLAGIYLYFTVDAPLVAGGSESIFGKSYVYSW